MEVSVTNLPENITRHLSEVAEAFGLDATEDTVARLGAGWMEKNDVFESSMIDMGMDEIPSFDKEDERGALALTFSGSLVSIGPLVDGKRKIDYTSIGFRNDVPPSGEILGICGLSGAGRSELARVLCGLDKAEEGSIELDGKILPASDMAGRMRKGIAYLTEDRKNEGLALRLLVDDNITAGIIPDLSRTITFNKARGRNKVKALIDELSIYPRDPSRTVANLSGGNQQKVLLAKWLATEPKLLILDEPTRGVDIGAKMIIHDAIEKAVEAGASVILISSDLPELVGLSDRVMIMRKGHFIREMSQEECSEEALLLAANGEGSV